MPTVTLKQVAQEAKVSYLTALRAMGCSPGQVREKTARRVRAAADRLDYRPSAAARALTSRTSPYIGVLYGMGPGCSRRIPASEMMRAYAEFHFELTAGLETRDYHVLTSNAAPHIAGPSAGDDAGIPKLLRQQHVGGLVVVGDIWPDLHREILRLRLPTVGIYCQSTPHIPTIDMNYQLAARLCTQHLLEQGHRRIALLCGQWQTWKTGPMQLGYLAALSQAAAPAVDGWDKLQDTAQAAGRWMNHPDKPTAIVVYDDYEAARVIERLESAGLRVPGDISIAAVQNMGLSGVRRPAISGCPIPAADMARRAVELLMNQLDGREQGARDEIIESSFVAGLSSREL